MPGELEPVTGAEPGLVEDPGVPEIGNGICDDRLGDAPVVEAGVAVSPGNGEGVEGVLADAPVVGTSVAVSTGDEAGVPVSPGNITGDVLGAAGTPGEDVDAGEGARGTLGETPGGVPDGDVASGDDSGEVSGAGVPVGVGGRGMVEPGTSDAWLLGVAGLLGDVGDWPGDLTAMLGDVVGAGGATGEEGDGEAGEEGVPVTGASGVAGDTEGIGEMGRDCTGELIGLGTVGDAAGLAGRDVELGVPAVLGVVVTVVGVAVATGDGDD